MEYDKCPICGSISHNEHTKFSQLHVNCFRCGIFRLNESGQNEIIKQKLLEKYNDIIIANISGWIRENQSSDIILTEEKMKSLITLKTLSAPEKSDNILKYLAKLFPIAGTPLNHVFDRVGNLIRQMEHVELQDKQFNDNISIILPLLSIGRIINYAEYKFIWEEYLIKTKNFISSEKSRIITPVGWAYLESLRQPNPDSKKAFVAMWFTDEMKEICEKYIKPAAEDAGGHKAEPINDKDYNGDINDEIIGEIRNSKFVIADFTGNRGGVYFEAGFAYGLNIPVIHTCKKDQLKNVHFDVNHRNIIVWVNGDDLYNKLVKRIKATIT